MKKIWRVAAAALVMTSVTPARADIVCSMAVNNLGITGTGWVTARFVAPGVNTGWWVCAVSGSRVFNDGYASGDITSDTCKVIYSQLLTAQTAGKLLNLSFKDVASCTQAALPANGSTLAPFPFNIETTP